MKVKLLSRVRLFATPWNTARQASLSITNSQNPPKPMSIESVMPSNHLILCCPLLLLPSIIPSTMEYYSAIENNVFESVLMRWMKLEPIIQNEVSHKEKHQYSLLTHIYGIYKDDPICEIGWWSYMWDSKRDTDVKNRLLDSVGEGKDGMIWDNSIETYILTYVK